MRNYFVFSKYSWYLVRRCTRKNSPLKENWCQMQGVSYDIWNSLQFFPFFCVWKVIMILSPTNTFTDKVNIFFPDMSVNRGCMHFIFEWEIWTKDYYWVCLYIYGISFFLILNSCLISAFSAINVIWSLKPKGQL